MSTLTDAELARLEELAKLYLSGNALPFAESDYRESSCNAVPSLVAEVRRLREKLDAEHSAWRRAEVRGDGLEEENAALRERVEALGWLVECYAAWGMPMLNEAARTELWLTKRAAHEAIS